MGRSFDPHEIPVMPPEIARLSDLLDQSKTANLQLIDIARQYRAQRDALLVVAFILGVVVCLLMSTGA